jgi:hypothetical protein
MRRRGDFVAPSSWSGAFGGSSCNLSDKARSPSESMRACWKRPTGYGRLCLPNSPALIHPTAKGKTQEEDVTFYTSGRHCHLQGNTRRERSWIRPILAASARRPAGDSHYRPDSESACSFPAASKPGLVTSPSPKPIFSAPPHWITPRPRAGASAPVSLDVSHLRRRSLTAALNLSAPPPGG